MSRRHENAVRFIDRQLNEYAEAKNPYLKVAHHSAAAQLIELAYKQDDISDAEHFDYYRRLSLIAEQAKGAA